MRLAIQPRETGEILGRRSTQSVMGFVGSINAGLRAMLTEMAPSWVGRDVYVGCSGNFTVERILWEAGVRSLHGNDVSLYTCTVGGYLAREPILSSVQDLSYSWLEAYMDNGGLRTIATLLLCSEALNYADRPQPYHRRMWSGYRAQWDRLHAETLAKVEIALAEIRLASFTPMDVLGYLATIPEGAVVIAFPPTYAGGYEDLYKKMDSVFAWEQPEYSLFDEKSFEEFCVQVSGRTDWVTLRDEDVPMLQEFHVGQVQTSLRSKPVNVYANAGTSRILTPKISTAQIPWPRASGELQGEMSLVRLEAAQLNSLRSMYLNPKIAPAAGRLSLGVLVGGEIVGALAFERGKWVTGIYIMSDFSIRPTPYKRLSKLVLCAVLSFEVKLVLEQAFSCRVTDLTTTAFTEKSMSMKYRGLFEVSGKKEGMVNYAAQAGRWTLQDGLQWWVKKHSKR